MKKEMITFVLIAFLGYMNSSAQGIDAYLRAYKEVKLSAEHEGVVSLDSKESTRFEKGITLFAINTDSIDLEIHIQELEKSSFNKEIRLLEKRLKSKKVEVAVGTQGTEVALNLEEDLILKQHKEKLLNAKIDIKDQNTAEVNLKNSEDGISPGQACVFYNKDKNGYKVLGGGWIKG